MRREKLFPIIWKVESDGKPRPEAPNETKPGGVCSGRERDQGFFDPLLFSVEDAVEHGTVVPIHKHPTKDESFVILRGKVRVTTHNDDGSIIEDVVLSQESGNYGVDIPKNVWHKLESLESGSVIFECKEGPFVEHEEEGILAWSRGGGVL